MHLHQKPGRDPHRNFIRYQKKILQVKKIMAAEPVVLF